MAASSEPPTFLTMPREVRQRILGYVAGPCFLRPSTLQTIDKLKELYVRFRGSQELRRQWNKVYNMVQDCDVVRSIHERHRYTPRDEYLNMLENKRCPAYRICSDADRLAAQRMLNGVRAYYWSQDAQTREEADEFEQERNAIRARIDAAEFFAYANLRSLYRIHPAVAKEMQWVERDWLSNPAMGIGQFEAFVKKPSRDDNVVLHLFPLERRRDTPESLRKRLMPDEEPHGVFDSELEYQRFCGNHPTICRKQLRLWDQAMKLLPSSIRHIEVVCLPQTRVRGKYQNSSLTWHRGGRWLQKGEQSAEGLSGEQALATQLQMRIPLVTRGRCDVEILTFEVEPACPNCRHVKKRLATSEGSSHRMTQRPRIELSQIADIPHAVLLNSGFPHYPL